MEKKIIIAGGRDFNNYAMLKEKVDHLLSIFVQNGRDITIVSGRANGADKLGELYAREKDYNVDLYPANWDAYGKRAGYLRNEEMANNANFLIAFWDGKSRGTKHMINLAKEKGLDVRIVHY